MVTPRLLQLFGPLVFFELLLEVNGLLDAFDVELVLQDLFLEHFF